MKAKPCPKCRYGYLMYRVEKLAGKCLACLIKERGISPTWPYPHVVYRSEGEEYYDTPGVIDDT